MTSTTTAVARTKQIKGQFEVIRQIEFLTKFPLAISLYDNSHTLSSLVKMIIKECALPIENEGICRIRQTEDSSVVKGARSDG